MKRCIIWQIIWENIHIYVIFMKLVIFFARDKNSSHKMGMFRSWKTTWKGLESYLKEGCGGTLF